MADLAYFVQTFYDCAIEYKEKLWQINNVGKTALARSYSIVDRKLHKGRNKHDEKISEIKTDNMKENKIKEGSGKGIVRLTPWEEKNFSMKEKSTSSANMGDKSARNMTARKRKTELTKIQAARGASGLTGKKERSLLHSAF